MARDPRAQWAHCRLILNGNGSPFPIAANVARVLERHHDWIGAVWFDRFHQRIRTDYGGGDPRDWTDADEVELLVFLQRELGIPRMGIEAVRQAVALNAQQRVRSELYEWITQLDWDREDRIGLLMTMGFGAEDTDYTFAVGQAFMKMLAARAINPGCKADTMVIFEGDQGVLKTTGLRELGGPYYGEISSALGTKDVQLEMRGRLLIEIAELEAMSKREVEAVKAFLSRQRDVYRPPYGRHAIESPRVAVFVGTTNEKTYLRDPTGARRFWPISCGEIDLEWIGENREQLFAEARTRVQNGESWWEVPVDKARREQELRYEGDPWEDPIERYVELKDRVLMEDVLIDACELERGRHDKRAQMRAAHILRRLGWERGRAGSERRREWRTTKPADENAWSGGSAGGAGGSKVVRMERRASAADDLPTHLDPPKDKERM
jgi:putative DNA primase/helicase